MEKESDGIRSSITDQDRKGLEDNVHVVGLRLSTGRRPNAKGKGIEIATEKGIPNYVGSARTTIQLGEGLHAMGGINDGMQDGVQTQGCHHHQATQPRLLKVSMDEEGGAATAKVSVTDKMQIDVISTSTIRTVEGTSKESGNRLLLYILV
ncbi:hypothetical protein FRX31_023422 [Thalictrum thalictroides]|uniref:Uncharacterized protein n=1 Tax=Thalictrum thalictroides TaxID=46969 RepID=A0A7J6VRJ4_THATH|nr:hypothetical protein FRX31_023422 [Thalictrum thalictroides]